MEITTSKKESAVEISESIFSKRISYFEGKDDDSPDNSTPSKRYLSKKSKPKRAESETDFNHLHKSVEHRTKRAARKRNSTFDRQQVSTRGDIKGMEDAGYASIQDPMFDDTDDKLYLDDTSDGESITGAQSLPPARGAPHTVSIAQEEAKYGYLQVSMSGHTYEMLYADDTTRGKGITRAQSLSPARANQKKDEQDRRKESKMAKMEKQLKAEKAKNQDLSEQMKHLKKTHDKKTKEKDNTIEHLTAQNEELKHQAKQVNEMTDVMANQGEENTEGKQSEYQYEKPLECIDEDKLDSEFSDDEYFAIPAELAHKLKRFAEEHLIQDCRVLQNPYNWRIIAVYGTDARKRLESQLNEFLMDNPEFKGYDVEAHDYTEDGQLNQLSFKFHCEAGAARSAICELVVQDRNKPSALLAVGPAHMLFCEEGNRHLMTENCNIDRVRKHMEQKQPTRKVEIRSEDVEIPVSETPYIAYRYKYTRGDDTSTPQHKLYTNDCALFESALTEKEKRQTEEKLRKARWWNKDLHVVSRARLQHVHSIRQSISIKNYRGALYHRVDIEKDIEDHKGIHLSFVLTSKDKGGEYRKLEAGDCGSIVYHVDKTPDNAETLTPWGMLITSEQTPHFVLYRAIVLQQAFTDIVNDYREKLSRLRLYQPSEHGNAAASNACHSISKGAVPPKNQYGSR